MTTRGPLRIVVAINPSASFGRGRAVGPAVVESLRSHGHEVTALLEPDFASLSAAVLLAISAEPDALVVVGGDGMVSLGTNALVGTSIPLGIVASGTGNDMARGLGLPVGDTPAAIEALLAALQRPARVIDAVLAHSADGTETWFAGVLSAGFDAIVNERANAMRFPRGKSRYTLALLIELARLRPISYRLVLDDEEFVVRGLLVSVGNNTCLGGGMKVTPNALLDDGLVDVMIVRPLSRLRFLRIFPLVFAGTHLSDPRVSVQRARRVRIEADGVVAYADGERVGRLPIDLEVHPGVLRVLAPLPAESAAQPEDRAAETPALEA